VTSRTDRQLAQLGLRAARFLPADVARECIISLARSPARTVLASLGTVLAAATAVATIGLASTARGAVSSTFNELRATLVTFTDSAPTQQPILTLASERAVGKLNGVRSAGLAWSIRAGSTFPVTRTSAPGAPSIGLPVTAASPGALRAMQATVSSGRLYDAGMEARRDHVALLGAAAAYQLGVSDVDLSPEIYVGGEPLTVIGIVSGASADTEALLGIVVPVTLAGDFAGLADTRQMIVRTTAGSAQLIGRQAPLAIDAYDPGRIEASVPLSPTQLRNQVESSVTSLLLAVSAVALLIGIGAIANTTLLSVIHRRQEIGLRRALGAAPRHIAALVIAEAASLGALGGTAGASIGIIAVSAVAAAHGWPPVLSIGVPVAAPAAGAMAGMVAGLYPAWRASRVTPIEALQR
jgi:putative ABC transport system permease protein